MDQRRIDLQHQLSTKRIITDGSILSVLIGLLVVGSMYYNAEIFHDDYPPAIQEKAGPMSQKGIKEGLRVNWVTEQIRFIEPTLEGLRNLSVSDRSTSVRVCSARI
jgi:hypothetical protein